jgi:cell cycle serine/threonine-protein kinase CDC5/MSD2
MAAVRGQPLQALGARELNTRASQHITPLKSTRRLEKDVNDREVEQAQHPPKEKAKKKKEKLSALCKTPPSLIRTRTGKDYKRGTFLGEGGFARCFQIRDDSGKVFAAKTVAKASIKSDKTKTKLLSEIKIHKSMAHPNVVQFIDCFEDDVNVYILLEICPNQSLMDLLKKRKFLTEPEVRLFMTQIIGGIRYMHTRRVIHRDLKLGNIFFDPDMNLKIGDFGLAAVLHADTDRKYTICGTPNYIAPEVLTGKTVGHSYEVDIWSIGVMMYALLVGKPPFQSKDVSLIYERIKSNDYGFPEDKPISNAAKELITDILTTNPLKRPTLDEILEYDFFKGPFPDKISIETLVSTPSFSEFDRVASQINFMNAKRAAGLIHSSSKNPVEILKIDLESEKPKSILPQSLSPGNTKSKYKEVPDPAITSKKVYGLEDSSSKLGRARRLDDHVREEKRGTGLPSLPVRLTDSILRQECTNTLNGISIAERQSRMRSSTNSHMTELKSPVLISKWVDYSNKHGFSYQLSTDDIGVLFNDRSTLLRVNHSNSFWFITNDAQDGWLASEYQADRVPQSLSRQVEVADFFARYMKTNLCRVSNDEDLMAENEEVFLRRYTRYDLYVMFELSNGSIQFNFRDHHKICISQTGSVITYISPERDSETCLLSQVLREGQFPNILYDIGLQEKFELIKEALRDKVNQ